MSIYEFTSQIFYHSGRWSDYESTFSIKNTPLIEEFLFQQKEFSLSKKPTAALTVLWNTCVNTYFSGAYTEQQCLGQTRVVNALSSKFYCAT